MVISMINSQNITNTQTAPMNVNRRMPLIFIVDDDTTTTRTIDGILKRAEFKAACVFLMWPGR